MLFEVCVLLSGCIEDNCLVLWDRDYPLADLCTLAGFLGLETLTALTESWALNALSSWPSPWLVCTCSSVQTQLTVSVSPLTLWAIEVYDCLSKAAR
jgi:hypothetical protein